MSASPVPRGRAAPEPIPFNKPYMVGTELDFIREAHANLQLAGDGAFTARCSRWLERQTGCHTALLTHSCTAALEMAALLLDVGPGDEIVMPSFTFVSTANAFVLRGATPVFVDIRPDTLNVDVGQIEAALTPRTRAIVVVHYAGVGCDMDAVMALAARHDLPVVEDAAQGLLSTYDGRPLGGIGHLGALSFHETKNVMSGEGGALLVNDPRYAERAQWIREKGTNRARFRAGLVDKYTWVDIGSSYLPGEMTAAFLWGQIGHAEAITAERLAIWDRYHRALAPLEADGLLRRPVVPAQCRANAHLYYVLLPDGVSRPRFLATLAAAGVDAVSHYVPLHDSPAGLRFGRTVGTLPITVYASAQLVRLPLWIGLDRELHRVVDAIDAALRTPR